MLKDISNFAVANLEIESNSFWREINPTAKSCSNLIKLLEIYASQDKWDLIVNLSSRAVLHLSKNYDRADFYHIWICALKETFDRSALIKLGKHLVKMGKFHSVYFSLSLIAFHYSSCKKTSKKIYKYIIRKKGFENRFTFESCGIYLASFKNSELNKNGISLLKKVCSEKKSSYFSWRNYLRVLSENNLIDEMSNTYNLIHEKFPFAQEPYLVAALIAMNSKEWNESIRILSQTIKDNPNNTNAVLAITQCYVENNEYIKALAVLSLKNHLFLENDYDYHYLMGVSLMKLVENNFDSNLKNLSISHLEKSLNLAKNFRFPVENIESLITYLKCLHSSNDFQDIEINENNIVKIHIDNSVENNLLFEERKI